MGERRRRPDLNPDGWGERPPATKDEINEKYKLIEKNSGILTIGGTRYKDVKTSQIKVLAVLGSGTCGTVHRVRFKDRVMAEKVCRIHFELFTHKFLGDEANRQQR